MSPYSMTGITCILIRQRPSYAGEVLESGKVFRRYTADWDGQHSHETPYWIIRYLTQIHREALICEDGDVWPANLYDEDNVAYEGGNRFK